MNKFLLLPTILWLFAACSTDDPVPSPPEEVQSTAVYILNSGNFRSNDATIDLYDTETKALQTNLFAINGRGLGDTGQHLLVFGAKIYITVSGSSTIEITDLTGKSLKQLDVKNNVGDPRMPRFLTHHDNKVYVTLFDGYVARIDTSALTIEQEVKVGDNPEQLVAAGNKLYVANSGGLNFPNYGKTVSVIDLNSFAVVKTLDVESNPQYLTVNSLGSTVYLISSGDYSTGSNILQRINTSTDAVVRIEGFNASWMSMGADDQLYIIATEYDELFNMTAKYLVYNTKSETLAGDFITDGTDIKNPYHISADKVNGTVYIGSSDYVSRGDIYVFSAEGKLLNRFGVSGINPEGVFFNEQ